MVPIGLTATYRAGATRSDTGSVVLYVNGKEAAALPATYRPDAGPNSVREVIEDTLVDFVRGLACE